MNLGYRQEGSKYNYIRIAESSRNNFGFWRKPTKITSLAFNVLGRVRDFAMEAGRDKPRWGYVPQSFERAAAATSVGRGYLGFMAAVRFAPCIWRSLISLGGDWFHVVAVRLVLPGQTGGATADFDESACGLPALLVTPWANSPDRQDRIAASVVTVDLLRASLALISILVSCPNFCRSRFWQWRCLSSWIRLFDPAAEAAARQTS